MSDTSSVTVRKQKLSNPLGLFALLSLDLVLEILYRIPIKSLLTLKCVSKPFNSFISDPIFANDHLRLSKIHHRHHNLLISPWAFFSEGNFFLLDSRLTSVFNNNSTTIVPDMKLNFPLNPSNIRAIITKVLNNGNGCGHGRVKVFTVSDCHGRCVHIAVVAV
jgi:hypothetical protein